VSLPGRRTITLRSRRVRWTIWGALAAVVLALLVVPSITSAPSGLAAVCSSWIALGVGFELVSIIGFILVFALVFGARMTRRQSLRAGLRALGASIVLPAGGLVGPALGARTAQTRGRAPRLVSSTIAFTILTTVPGVAVLGVLGLSLWLGWPAGPHCALRTLPAASLAWGLLVAVWFTRGSPRSGRPSRRGRGSRWCRIMAALRAAREGPDEARRIVAAGNWKLTGTLCYYAFDNAVLWAAFHADGRPQPIGVIVMGYLVGSLGSLLPVPGGIGAVEGGLIGALVLYGAPPLPAAGAVLLYRGISLSLPLLLSAGAWAPRPDDRRDGPRRRRRAVRAIILHGAGSAAPPVAASLGTDPTTS
jgi:uncharacterized membrane protein YbhN (UPF0104 family)